MVQKVIAIIKVNDREKTFTDVNNLYSPFRDCDLYVTTNDMHGKNLAQVSIDSAFK